MNLTRFSILIFLCLILTALSTLAALTTGDQAPDFTLQTTTDETISLSDYRGQVVILHFWKSN